MTRVARRQRCSWGRCGVPAWPWTCRDPHFVLHANPGDGSMDCGHAKFAGRAPEVFDDALTAEAAADAPGHAHAFRLDLTNVVLTSVRGNRLVVEHWRSCLEVTTTERT